ncbi:hypothetical protein [Motilimonas eburnea]|uniref:hypothetical protein n=1 Tax=Motilimonas eburnea TaxID=1737488 RepID=UPI001E414F22|nr:hypothetical protein [Motilimonas eburnea]MCE2570714.1 hypothetical protein [Motilimonas eburnea]
MVKLFVFVFLLPLFAHAGCPSEVDYKAKYILSADVVSLVKVVGREEKDETIEYEFSVIENLRGDNWVRFIEFPIVSRDITFYKGKDSTFTEHKNPVFWVLSTGVLRYSKGFGVVKEFDLGKNYLIVYNPKNVASYAFEEISNKDDFWYQFVTNVVKGEDYCDLSISVDDFYSVYIDVEQYEFASPQPPRKLLLPGDNGKHTPGRVDIYSADYRDSKKYAGYSVYSLSARNSFKVVVPYNKSGVHDFSGLDIFPKIE